MTIKLLLLSVLYLGFTSQAFPRPFTILSTQSAPFKYLDKHQQPAGLHVDVWKIIFQELEVKHEFKFVNWGSKRVKTEIEKGNADLHFSLSKKKEREKLYIYPRQSYHSQRYSFFIRKKDKGRIKYDSLKDLKGLIVGATQSYTYTKEFWNIGLNLDVITNNSLHLQKLLKGRIDVALLKFHASLYELEKTGELDSIYVLSKPLTERASFAAFSRISSQKDKQKVIENYDRIIRRLKRDGTIKNLYVKYFKYSYQ